MSKLFNTVVLATALSVQANAVMADWSNPHEKRQVSRLYATIPGDPNFRLNDEPIHRTRAVLKRSEEGLSVVVDSRDLEPGAYSIWMRVFNQPELCSGGEGVQRSVCSRGDDLVPPIDPMVPNENGESTASVFWISSALVGDDGKVHISASVDTNEWPGLALIGTDVAGTELQAVWNPLGAEIHIVLRYHGPTAAAEGPILWRDPVTGALNDVSEEENAAFNLLGRQLNRFLGNCSPVFGEPASNCEDAQLAVFAPPKKRKRFHY